MMDSTEQKTPGFMVYCVLVACLESLSNGWVIGSPNIPGEVTHNCPTGNAHLADKLFPDCLPMPIPLWGFAVASFCVGGLVGGLLGGEVQTWLGRKKTIVINTSGFIIGSILSSASVHPAMFIVGRIFSGLSCGVGSLAVPTYIGEVSTTRARGMMGACNQLLVAFGIFLSSAIGLPLSAVPLWRINYAIAAIPAVVQFFLMPTCAESPRWLVSANRVAEAREALQDLRGDANIDAEFYEIVEGQMGTTAANSILANRPLEKQGEFDSSEKKVDTFGSEELCYNEDADEEAQLDHADASDAGFTETQLCEQLSLLQIFTDPVIRRITFSVLSLHAIQQLIGMNAVMYYSTTILQSMFDSYMAQVMAIISTVVNFLASIVAVVYVDRVGRRPLLMAAEVGTTVFSVLMVIGHRFNIGALLVVALFGYVASFAIGIGPIPWLITSELSPTRASSSVGAAATCMNWSMNFVIGQLFPVIYAAIQGYTYAIFACVGALSLLFTYFCIPETKNRSIESIVREYERRKRK